MSYRSRSLADKIPITSMGDVCDERPSFDLFPGIEVASHTRAHHLAARMSAVLRRQGGFMNKKLVLAIASLALIMTGSALPRSLFGQPAQPRTPEVSAGDSIAAEALRHCQCQPRHWKSMILQK
jgi:hypothetical protein